MGDSTTRFEEFYSEDDAREKVRGKTLKKQNQGVAKVG
jgi:hypothetical protein